MGGDGVGRRGVGGVRVFGSRVGAYLAGHTTQRDACTLRFPASLEPSQVFLVVRTT